MILDSGGRSGDLLRNRFSPGTSANIPSAAEGSDAHDTRETPSSLQSGNRSSWVS